MPAIVKITPALFDDLYRWQLRDWNPRISEARWRRAFQCSQTAAEDYSGYAMTDGEKIVGVLGMMFSERRINGRTARLCNLHSWRVDPEYRAKSLLMLRPIAALQDHTITDLTSHSDVVAIIKRIGLGTLDQRATILPWLPWKSRANGLTIREMTEPVSQYDGVLSPDDAAIYRDHQDLDCGHLLVQTQQGYCYIVSSSIKHRWTQHCLVHYISSLRLFAAHHAAIRASLMRASRSRWVVVDTRLLADTQLPYTFQLEATEKLYRSNQLAPHEIDSLYTEQAVLKHSSLLPISAKFREKLSALRPSQLRKPKPTTR